MIRHDYSGERTLGCVVNFPSAVFTPSASPSRRYYIIVIIIIRMLLFCVRCSRLFARRKRKEIATGAAVTPKSITISTDGKPSNRVSKDYYRSFFPPLGNYPYTTVRDNDTFIIRRRNAASGRASKGRRQCVYFTPLHLQLLRSRRNYNT